MAQRTKEEVKEYTTQRILEALKGGKIPWNKPWTCALHNGMSFNFTTDKMYNGGFNQILLNLSAMANGWNDPRWTGRNQALKKGCNIRGLTNTKGTMIFAPMMKSFTNDEGERSQYCKGFREVIVFNASQIIDYPSFESLDIPSVDPEIGFAEAARVLRSSGAKVNHGGDRAFYSPAMDFIQLPEAGQFDSVSGYWSTAMHELTHWTGADSRLKREMFGKGQAKYAYEELVAEMGSAFICSWLGIDKPEVTKNHEAYIQSWIQRLDNDTSVFMDASSMAWKAFRLLIPG